MKTKIALLLAVLCMVTVSVSYASVTVSIDGPYTVTPTGEVTVPISIQGYTNFYAGYVVVDFGKLKVEDVTVESKAGYIYPSLADYAPYTLKSQWDSLTQWYNTKDAAVDYGLYGSKFKLIWVAPKAQTESNAITDGNLFDLKFTVLQGSKSEVVFLGGEVLNNNTKEAKGLGAYAQFNVSGAPPITIISTPDALTQLTADEAKNITAYLDMGGLNGAIPSALTSVTLKNEDTQPGKDVGLELKGGTQIQKSDGTAYTGFLKPPEAKGYTELSKEEQDLLPPAWKDDVYKISVGAAEKLKLAQNALMLLKVRLKTKSPKVYYLPPVGPPEEAGVQGAATVEGKQYTIPKGGLILGSSSASGGLTDYTIAVLLDHLSEYAVGPDLTPPAEAPIGGGGGTCFIATAVFGSPDEWHVKALREFRDRYLIGNSLGKAFVDSYYKYSPSVALYLKDHEVLKGIVRVTLVPVAGFAYVALNYPILLLVLLIGLMAVAAFVGKRRFL